MQRTFGEWLNGIHRLLVLQREFAFNTFMQDLFDASANAEQHTNVPYILPRLASLPQASFAFVIRCEPGLIPCDNQAVGHPSILPMWLIRRCMKNVSNENYTLREIYKKQIFSKLTGRSEIKNPRPPTTLEKRFKGLPAFLSVHQKIHILYEQRIGQKNMYFENLSNL